MIIPHPDLLVDPIVRRRQYTVLQGASHSGKTMLLLQLIAALQTESPTWLGLIGRPDLRLGLLTCDQSPDVYEETATEAGADLSQVAWYSYQQDRTDPEGTRFATERFAFFLHVLDTLNRGDRPIDLFFVEPFGTWIDVNLINYTQSVTRLAHFTRWLQQQQCAVFVTHHVNKARTNQCMMRAMDRGNTAAPLHGYSYAVVTHELATELSTKPTTASRARLTIQTRHTAPQEMWIDRSQTSGCWVPVNPARCLHGGLSARQERLIEWIKDQGTPVPRRVLKAVWLPLQGVSEKSLDRDLAALVLARILVHDGQGYRLRARG